MVTELLLSQAVADPVGGEAALDPPLESAGCVQKLHAAISRVATF